MQVGGEALDASKPSPPGYKGAGTRGLRLCERRATKFPLHPNSLALSCLGPPPPGSPEPGESAAASSPRATSAFQLSRGVHPHQAESVPPLRPPRARPQLLFWALTWASPGAALGVRAPPDPAAVWDSEGGRLRVSGGG